MLIEGVAIDDLAQLMVGVAAIAALFLGPAMGFKNARRLSVASNRQEWLDGVRADLARIIAIHGELVIHRAKQAGLANKAPDPPDLQREIGELNARVRMRLNMDKPLQSALNEQLTKFITNYDSANPNDLIKAMDPIADEVWRDIKAGRI